MADYRKTAVLIPCFNEEKTVGKVIDDWEKALPGASIYVYDNASTDRTSQEAARHGAIVRKERWKGKGNVIRRMFREIEADCYVMVDGDDTYGTEIAKEMVQMVLEEGMDMVIGDRLSSTYVVETTRRFHNFGNNAVKVAVNLIFQSNIRDVMSGLRAFSHRFIQTYPVTCAGFEIETEMTIFALDHRMPIVCIPVQYKEREVPEESKVNTVPDGIRVFIKILALCKDYRPVMFFTVISIILLILAAGFMVPVLREFKTLHTVSRFPTLIVCGFTCLAAIISFFSGLVLDSIRKMELRQAERKYAETEKVERIKNHENQDRLCN